ncbi:hypothetical protein HK100_007520 [Physocladia obscura]|uniref:J domain-containing protein n=1 Tax=Physocladia obscura TaxID=109957 RepID=A0AAD5T7D2_9FUNG|nr:hypothetical protein HK100_007520 [Physocladia obscura]
MNQERAGASIWTDENPAAYQEQNYYDVLGVARDANADEIRRANQSHQLYYAIHVTLLCTKVRCHPDKAGNDPAAAEQFQRISKAHDVLSDEKKRQVYDKYGANGVEMMDKVPFLDVSMILALKNMFCLITILVAVLLLWPIFISMKVDEKISWSWPVVFIPSFIVIAAALLGALGAPLADDEVDPDDEEAHVANTNKKKSTLSKVLNKIITVVYVALILVFDVLVSLKLETTLSANWGSVFAPWFIFEALNFQSKVSEFLIRIKEGVPEKVPETLDEEQDAERPTRPHSTLEILLLATSAFNFFVLRLIQAIILVYKLGHQDSMSWPAVFTPLYILISLNLISFLVFFLLRIVPTVQTPQEKRSAYIIFGIAFAFAAALLSGFTYLFVRRVSGSDGWPPAAIVLIPVFFLFAISLCCCGCFLPCIVTVGLRAQMEEMGTQNSGAPAESGQQSDARQNQRIPVARQIAGPSVTTLN